jgi:putative pantetheine hydrolase
MQWLAERNTGFAVGAEPHQVVPIVPTAVLFDLGAGGDFRRRPDASFGYRAAAAASRRKIAQGTVGAGTGAHAASLKGGLGSASVVLPSGITVAALVAANPAGSVVDPATGELWGVAHGLPGEFAHLRRPSAAELRAANAKVHEPPSLNTTLAIVATDARLDKSETNRLAMAAHDGMARSIRPVHTYMDGDVAFSLATGALEVPDVVGASDDVGPTRVIRPASMRPVLVSVLIAAAADVVARAIAHAVLHANSVCRMTSYLDEFPSARV